MSIILIAVGYSPPIHEPNDANVTKKLYLEVACLNVFGYLPLVSGIVRCIWATQFRGDKEDSKNLNWFANAHTVRGIAEIIGLGVIYGLLDLIHFIYWACHNKSCTNLGWCCFVPSPSKKRGEKFDG